MLSAEFSNAADPPHFEVEGVAAVFCRAGDFGVAKCFGAHQAQWDADLIRIVLR